MNVSRVKKDGSKTIFVTAQEFDDLKSVFSLAIRQAKKDHKDSPNFLKAIKRMNKSLWDLKPKAKE
jgi:hypothetical protein